MTRHEETGEPVEVVLSMKYGRGAMTERFRQRMIPSLQAAEELHQSVLSTLRREGRRSAVVELTVGGRRTQTAKVTLPADEEEEHAVSAAAVEARVNERALSILSGEIREQRELLRSLVTALLATVNDRGREQQERAAILSDVEEARIQIPQPQENKDGFWGTPAATEMVGKGVEAIGSIAGLAMAAALEKK